MAARLAAQNTNKAPKRIAFFPDLHQVALEYWQADMRVLGWIEGQDFIVLPSEIEAGSRNTAGYMILAGVKAGLALGSIHCRFWGSAMKRREYITLLVVAAGIWPSVAASIPSNDNSLVCQRHFAR